MRWFTLLAILLFAAEARSVPPLPEGAPEGAVEGAGQPVEGAGQPDVPKPSDNNGEDPTTNTDGDKGTVVEVEPAEGGNATTKPVDPEDKKTTKKEEETEKKTTTDPNPITEKPAPEKDKTTTTTPDPLPTVPPVPFVPPITLEPAKTTPTTLATTEATTESTTESTTTPTTTTESTTTSTTTTTTKKTTTTTTTTTTTPPPVPPLVTTTQTTSTTTAAGAAELQNNNTVIYGVGGFVIFLIILCIIIFLVVRRMKKKKDGDKPKKSMGKSRTPSTRNNTTDTSQQVLRPLIPQSNASERPGKGGAPTGSGGQGSTPAADPTGPAQVPQMKDLNETPGGLPDLATTPFIPGEEPYKIPAKNFKWKGPLVRRTRWHGDPKHDLDGKKLPEKLEKIWFDPNANYASEIGPNEIMEDGGPPSDSNRSEWLNNLDEWEKGHKAMLAAQAAEAAGKGKGEGGDSKKESKKESKKDPPA